ncbi:MAG: hypothetical protein IT381_21120 [Deltaproteobacteria bacterium]|nr:hypothetical protein [Deltaproteobacteria bacterium]
MSLTSLRTNLALISKLPAAQQEPALEVALKGVHLDAKTWAMLTDFTKCAALGKDAKAVLRAFLGAEKATAATNVVAARIAAKQPALSTNTIGGIQDGYRLAKNDDDLEFRARPAPNAKAFLRATVSGLDGAKKSTVWIDLSGRQPVGFAPSKKGDPNAASYFIAERTVNGMTEYSAPIRMARPGSVSAPGVPS